MPTVTLISAPWWAPKLALKLYAVFIGAYGAFLSKLGMHAPYVIDVQWGTNASILTAPSLAMPIRDYLQIVEAAESHVTLGTDGSAVTMTIEKLTGTQAPGAGQNMFKTSTFNLKAAVNTVQRLVASQLTGLTVAQKAGQLLAPGDRLSFTFTGVLTSVTGVGVTVILKPYRQQATTGR